MGGFCGSGANRKDSYGISPDRLLTSVLVRWYNKLYATESVNRRIKIL